MEVINLNQISKVEVFLFIGEFILQLNLLDSKAKISNKGNYASQGVEIKGKFAEYILYNDGKPIAIIEAKTEGDVSLESALQQAKLRYVGRIENSYDNLSNYNAPFIFAK